MADISKDDLKKEITGILKGADLATTSAKKVRQEVEEKLGIDLTSRKKEVDEIVMQCLKESKKSGAGKKGVKKNGNKEEEDDEEEEEKEEEEEEEEDKEEEEEDEEEEEEEKKPKRSAGAKKAAAATPPAKKKKTSSDESEDEQEDKESDEEYSPSKKSKASKGKGKGGKGRKKKGSDSDSDEDWGKGAKKAPAKKPAGKRGGGGGYNRACQLTPELAAVVGSETMARHEVVKKVWSIIKEQNLYDPKNKQYAICNDDLMKVIGVKRFRTFGMMKYLKKHFVD